MIGKKMADGTIKAIYCHWDGYPEGVGDTLLQAYQEPEKIDALMALGDLSVLGAEIGETQDFEEPKSGTCLAYGRDRGEENVDVRICADETAFVQLAGKKGAEYAYLFDGAWKVADVPYVEVAVLQFQDLAQLLKEEEGEAEDA
jgi:hypothetical protein